MEATQQPPQAPTGSEGQPCPECGAPMAVDQRYCLNCGNRRGAPRVPVAEQAGERPAEAAAPAESQPGGGRPNDVSPLGAVLGVALLGGMLLIGVLIGRGDTSNDQPPAQTIQVGANGAAATTTATTPQNSEGSAGGVVTSDWPPGTDGFTVQLSTLPKDGTSADAVDAAVSDAEANGASEVGVLDSDLYPSLPAGNYVIYSGIFDAKSGASKSLDDLGSSFPTAQVVEVSGTGASSGSSSGTGSGAANGAIAPQSQDLGASGALSTPQAPLGQNGD